MNPLVAPAVIGWCLLFWFGTRPLRPNLVGLGLVSSILLALPGLLFSAYYTKLFGEPIWLYQFRSLPFTDLLAAGSGLLFGWLQAEAMCRETLRRRIGKAAVPLLGLFTVLLPFLKPVVGPIRETFYDQWRGDVCMQTTPSTCGPASAATIFRHFGVRVTEEELAKECFSSRTGTENWYLARAFRRRGFEVEFRRLGWESLSAATPALVGTVVAGRGHFIPVLAAKNGKVTLGDPLVGLETVSLGDGMGERELTGFVMQVRRLGDVDTGSREP